MSGPINSCSANGRSLPLLIDSAGVKAQATGLGFSLVGICDPSPPAHLDVLTRWIEAGYAGTMDYMARSLPLRADPAGLLPGVNSLVMVGLDYFQENPVVEGEGRIATYALGRDYHRVIRGKLKRLVAWLQMEHPGHSHRICVDSAPLMEREYANRAGLGWFGKNTCLINSRRGSWFFIASVLTTIEFERDAEAVGGCGNCRLCIDACPTGAIVSLGDVWQVDSRRCISYQTIEHKGDIEVELDDWIFGCDICQSVCPFNQARASQPERCPTTEEPDFLATRVWPNLEQLSVIQPEEWDNLTRGSATRRAGLEGLRRNARSNLARPPS